MFGQTWLMSIMIEKHHDWISLMPDIHIVMDYCTLNTNLDLTAYVILFLFNKCFYTIIVNLHAKLLGLKTWLISAVIGISHACAIACIIMH